MRILKCFISILILILFNGCIVQFIPEIDENQELLVVDGLITDQLRTNTIIITKSVPIGTSLHKSTPVSEAIVYISDNNGTEYDLYESIPGIYVTDSLTFRGIIGNVYTLHIVADGLSYESYPMELKYVPPIDSLYYEVIPQESKSPYVTDQGCQIYVTTHDPYNICRYYRWDYTETWEIHLPYIYPPNKKCWVTNNSQSIYIKSTAAYEEDRVPGFPVIQVTDNTDRLKERYSILMRQYSLCENEYQYWERLQKSVEMTGGLYDVIPMAIPGNIQCIEKPEEKVLGYFSVSSVSTKRIFISNIFRPSSFPDYYKNCAKDTIPSTQPIPNLNVDIYIMEAIYKPFIDYPFYILTDIKGCSDCTVRGTNIMPDYWEAYK